MFPDTIAPPTGHSIPGRRALASMRYQLSRSRAGPSQIKRNESREKKQISIKASLIYKSSSSFDANGLSFLELMNAKMSPISDLMAVIMAFIAREMPISIGTSALHGPVNGQRTQQQQPFFVFEPEIYLILMQNRARS